MLKISAPERKQNGGENCIMRNFVILTALLEDVAYHLRSKTEM
jgi:hypothetical protein